MSSSAQAPWQPRVHHLAVRVTDLQAGLRFYRDLLGLAVLREWHDEAGLPRSYWLSLGDGAFLAVERAHCDEPRRHEDAPGWHCVALCIPRSARETWRQKLAQGGHPVFRETGFTIYAHDPDGNIVALSHYPEAAEY